MVKGFESILIFEDEGYKNLLPLTYLRPTWGLRCGMTVLLEKVLRAFKKVPYLHCRDYLIETLKTGGISATFNKVPDVSACLLINGRVLAKNDLAKKLEFGSDDEVLLSGEQVVAARLSGERLQFIRKALGNALSRADFEPLKLDVRFRQTDIKLLSYPWDLVHENAEQIRADFNDLFKSPYMKGAIHPLAHIYEKDNVIIEAGSEIMVGAVLDAREGPIYIGKSVQVHPHSRIDGPCYIGDRTKILGGKVRAGCSIGPVCKVNGEIEGSIIQGYSNKQHDGFIGHSYICEWVNLGAMTTNSDLKNNYGPVKVVVNGTEMDSGQTFVGSFIGDHTKTGIGTLLNTGTSVGVACNIFGTTWRRP
jgi:UDP-N-acetylglucosamine diphosphorylase/glucosamine-1-phosphate N-acetyltransferase